MTVETKGKAGRPGWLRMAEVMVLMVGESPMKSSYSMLLELQTNLAIERGPHIVGIVGLEDHPRIRD